MGADCVRALERIMREADCELLGTAGPNYYSSWARCCTTAAATLYYGRGKKHDDVLG